MTIITKFNPGDTVYYISDNKIKKTVVNSFFIQSCRISNEVKGVIDVSAVDIIYKVGSEYLDKLEVELFKSPEDLFEHLKSNIKNY